MTGKTPQRGSQSNSALLGELLEAHRLEPGRTAWVQLGRSVGILARGRPYGWRYLLSLWSGTLPLTAEFRLGAERSLAVLDGSSPILARSVEVRAFALDPAVGGSLVMSSPRVCSCGVRFVPNVPWRTRCPGCSPPHDATKARLE